MTLCTILHLYNVRAGGEGRFEQWFEGKHRSAVQGLRGFRECGRYEATAEQVMADIPQPWRYLGLYEFDLPSLEIDLPALGPLLAEARDAEWIADDGTERIYAFELYSDWNGSANWVRKYPFSGVSVLLGNFTPGRESEYHQWYDEVHGPEVAGVPGKVALKRGRLSSVQIEPRRHCPGDQLVLCAQQTDDLAFTIGEFIARAIGQSPSHLNMKPRSAAASTARTVHYFKKIDGRDFWPGGIAYADEPSCYAGKRFVTAPAKESAKEQG